MSRLGVKTGLVCVCVFLCVIQGSYLCQPGLRSVGEESKGLFLPRVTLVMVKGDTERPVRDVAVDVCVCESRRLYVE